MAVAHVQSIDAVVAGGSSLAPSLSGVVAGAFLHAGVGCYISGGGTGNINSVSGGGTWSGAYQTTGGFNQAEAAAFYCASATGGTTNVTVSLDSGAYAACTLSEFSGVAASPYDVGASNTQAASSGTFTSASTSTTTQADAVAIATFVLSVADTACNIATTGSGYSNVGREQDSNSYIGQSLDYKILSATGAQSCSWTFDSQIHDAGSLIGVFKADAGGGPPASPEYVGGVAAGFVGGTGTGTQSLTGLTGGLASAPAEGDLVIVAYAIGTAGRNPTQTITGNNSGAYSHVSGSPLLSSADTYDADLAVFYKFMGATPDTQVTRSATGNAQDGGALAVHVWRGVDPTTPFDVTPTTATGQDTDRANPPSITPSTSGAVVVVAAGGAAQTLTTAWTSSDLSNLVQANGADTNDGRAAIGSAAWTSGAFDPAQFGGGSGNAANSWCAITMALRPAVDTTDDLTATGVSSGTPSVGSPAITQAHTLTATGVAAAAPSVGAPALTQAHDLAAAGVDAGTPSVGAPTLAEAAGQDDLMATGVDAGVPSVGVPALTQAHGLAATGVDAGAPTVGAPSITQSHALAATGAAPAAPSVGSPALTQAHALAATGVSAGAPSVGAPAITQAHVLAAAGAATSAPSVGAPILAQIHALAAAGIAAGAPSVGAPVLAEPDSTDDLSADSIAAAAPSVGSPAIVQVHALGTASIAAGGPSVGTPTLSQLHALLPISVVAGVPQIEAPALGQAHTLGATGIAAGVPGVGAPSLTSGETFVDLVAIGITAGQPIVGLPWLNFVPAPGRVVAEAARVRVVAAASARTAETIAGDGRSVAVTGGRTVAVPASSRTAS